jgi:glycine/D-amino acid oxidase-like deaminating enzyme
MDPWFAEALSPVREQALLVSGPGPVHAMRSGYGYTSWVPTDHGLVVAGCRFATPHMEMGEVDDTVTTPAIQERLEASVARFFPHPDREVLARWSWITARGCDGLPLVGPMPGNPAVVVCAGFMGLEGSLGIAAADGVVEGMLTGEARRVPERLAPIRLI